MSEQIVTIKQKAGRIARRGLWMILIGLILFGAGTYFYRTYVISEGTRTGTLFKISKKGYLFKTYEGQIHLAGSMMITDQSTWDFSAENEAVYLQLQQLEGKSVTCHYKELKHAFPWQGDTNYIVYQAELARQ